LLQRGADILRQLEEFSAPASGKDFEARIEAAIAARRADAARERRPSPGGDGSRPVQDKVGIVDDDLEARIAARRRERQDRSAGFCPHCGRPIQKSDRFCPKCGAALEQA
jgi:hypothetical protein